MEINIKRFGNRKIILLYSRLPKLRVVNVILNFRFKGIIYLSKLRTVNYKNGEEVPKDPVEETRGKSIGTKFEQYMAHGT